MCAWSSGFSAVQAVGRKAGALRAFASARSEGRTLPFVGVPGGEVACQVLRDGCFEARAGRVDEASATLGSLRAEGYPVREIYPWAVAVTDLAETQQMPAPARLDKSAMARALLVRLSRSRVLSVAAINGLAYGGGLELDFARFLHEANDCQSFAKNYLAVGFRLDYVKADAPKGGELRLVSNLRVSTFDKYNPFTVKGSAPAYLSGLLFDTLLTGSLDETNAAALVDLLVDLQKEMGLAIVMVTHELDIASYCKRMVIMRDGIVISDTPTTNRRMADEERARLNEAERDARLDSPP